MIIERFKRVKGSGPFHLDDFCAATGMEQGSAVKELKKAEKHGLIVSYGSLYLLKPDPPVAKPRWYDWKPNQSSMELIWSLISPKQELTSDPCPFAYDLQGWTPRQDIAAASGLKDTTLARYLRLMIISGFITSKRAGTKMYYQRVASSLGKSASWQTTLKNHNKRS